VQIPGCTTIISRFKDSGGLLYWAFQQGKSGADSLYEKAEEAADIGTYTHAMFEAHRRGQPTPKPVGLSDLQIERAETALIAALDWEKYVQFESVALEQSLVCECYQYGCTIDEIARVNGKLEDCEWKTSGGIYVDHLIQIAAQKHAWECNNPELRLEAASVIRFSRDTGEFAWHHFTDFEEPFAQFVRFREAYDVDQRLKRRVR